MSHDNAPHDAGGEKPSRKKGKHAKGFIVVVRSMLDAPAKIIKDPGLCQLWLYLMLRASHRRRAVEMKTGRGKTTVTIERGQLIASDNKIAHFLAGKRATIQRRMRALESMGSVKRDAGTHFTIITVCNYDFYQRLSSNRGPDSGHPNGQASGPDSGHPNGAQSGHIQSIGTLNHGNSKPVSAPPPADASPPEAVTKPAKKARGTKAPKPVRTWGVEALTIPPAIDTPDVRAELASYLERRGPHVFANEPEPKYLNRILVKCAQFSAAWLVDRLIEARAKGWDGFFFKEDEQHGKQSSTAGPSAASNPSRVHSGRDWDSLPTYGSKPKVVPDP